MGTHVASSHKRLVSVGSHTTRVCVRYSCPLRGQSGGFETKGSENNISSNVNRQAAASGTAETVFQRDKYR